MEEIKAIFSIFDQNGNGEIDEHELENVLKSMGENVTKEDVKLMISECDTNQNGKVEFQEFYKMWTTKLAK